MKFLELVFFHAQCNIQRDLLKKPQRGCSPQVAFQTSSRDIYLSRFLITESSEESRGGVNGRRADPVWVQLHLSTRGRQGQQHEQRREGTEIHDVHIIQNAVSYAIGKELLTLNERGVNEPRKCTHTDLMRRRKKR